MEEVNANYCRRCSTTNMKRTRLPESWGNRNNDSDDDENRSVASDEMDSDSDTQKNDWMRFVQSRSRMFRGRAFLSEEQFRSIVRKRYASTPLVDDANSAFVSKIQNREQSEATMAVRNEALSDDDSEVILQIKNTLNDDGFDETNAQLVAALFERVTR
jgi:hypothetical protein